MPRRAALLAEVLRHAPADELESQHRHAFVELLNGCPDAYSRAHFKPGHVTASVYVVDEERGLLLLHHHRRLDRWLQMGGHVEAGESPRDAALREGREESGLDDLDPLTDEIVDLDVHFIPAAKGEPGHDHYDVRYIAVTRTPERISLDPEESRGLAWFGLDEAITLMNEAAASRVILKIRQMLEARRLT